MPPARLTARAERLVVVEALDNPANVGAVVRSAAALGWDGLLLDRDSADPLARRSLRVAMGTAFALPHARVDDVVATLGELRALGVAHLRADADRAAHDVDVVDPPRRCAVVIGSERTGLSPAVLGACGQQVPHPAAPTVSTR